MNTSVLFAHFSSALTWNALFYLVYKSIFIMRTLLLYSALPAQDFATWAMLNSIIFLLLLWLDFGLRKAIPRYAPVFASLKSSLMPALIRLQSFILLLALPIVYYCVAHITHSLPILCIAIVLYLLEGIHTIMRSLYHAYFHNRYFNQLSTTLTLADMALMLISVIFLPVGHLLCAILLGTLITRFVLVVSAIRAWHQQPAPLVTAPPINEQIEQKKFIKHALFMWVTTILTSISERNFLVPFITYGVGIDTGTLFKVANDGALFFYRMIIKTIGSADTALLAHMQVHNQQDRQNQYPIHKTIQKLSTQIGRLVLPLLGIVGLIILIGWRFYHDTIVFQAFLIMAIGYILETIWIPYERVLEVQQNYRVLFIIYIIYSISIALLFIFFISSWIGLLPFLICVHGVRLVTGMSMRAGVYLVHWI